VVIPLMIRYPFVLVLRNEHIIAHNILLDIVATIVLESGTHVQREVSHLFLHRI
jgi:hypothetical protein